MSRLTSHSIDCESLNKSFYSYPTWMLPELKDTTDPFQKLLSEKIADLFPNTPQGEGADRFDTGGTHTRLQFTLDTKKGSCSDVYFSSEPTDNIPKSIASTLASHMQTLVNSHEAKQKIASLKKNKKKRLQAQSGCCECRHHQVSDRENDLERMDASESESDSPLPASPLSRPDSENVEIFKTDIQLPSVPSRTKLKQHLAARAANRVQTRSEKGHKPKGWGSSGGVQYANDEERRKVRDFWLDLPEHERRELVRLEKEAVLVKMKEQQRHSCPCASCNRKRAAIEDELELLYDAYYDELEDYALRQQGAGTTQGSDMLFDTRFTDPEDFEEDYLEEEENEEDYMDNGLLSVANDLLRNDGKRFLEVMERLAEQRIRREDRYLDDEGVEEEDYLDEEYLDDELDTDSLGDDQRLEDGRRMFQVFAARMFEQRVYLCFKERQARAHQDSLLAELEREEQAKKDKEAKKLREREKKREKKNQQRQQKEQERKMREDEERKRKEGEQQRLEDERRIKEEERKRKEEEKRKQIQEQREREMEKLRLKKEAEREKARQLQAERKEQKAKRRAELVQQKTKPKSPLLVPDVPLSNLPKAEPVKPVSSSQTLNATAPSIPNLHSRPVNRPAPIQRPHSRSASQQQNGTQPIEVMGSSALLDEMSSPESLLLSSPVLRPPPAMPTLPGLSDARWIGLQDRLRQCWQALASHLGSDILVPLLLLLEKHNECFTDQTASWQETWSLCCDAALQQRLSVLGRGYFQVSMQNASPESASVRYISTSRDALPHHMLNGLSSLQLNENPLPHSFARVWNAISPRGQTFPSTNGAALPPRSSLNSVLAPHFDSRSASLANYPNFQ